MHICPMGSAQMGPGTYVIGDHIERTLAQKQDDKKRKNIEARRQSDGSCEWRAGVIRIARMAIGVCHIADV